jgi:hypothetical protein
MISRCDFQMILQVLHVFQMIFSRFIQVFQVFR